MPWTWRYEKADGTVVPADDLQEAIFISQGDAESWLGENWRALLAVGVDQVTLFDDTKVEYGPMSLHPEDLRADSAAPLQPRGRCPPSKVRYSSGPGRYTMQLNPSRRIRRPRAIVILCAVIVAVAAAVITWRVSQHQTAAPPAACGSAWTHRINGQTQLLGADHGSLTCFDAAARACRPASLHVTEFGVDTGTDYVFTIESGRASCRVTESSQYYSANGGGSHGPVVTTSCLRTAVTGGGVSLSCAGQDLLIPAKVHPGLS
jgi:hypothetical protein